MTNCGIVNNFVYLSELNGGLIRDHVLGSFRIISKFQVVHNTEDPRLACDQYCKNIWFGRIRSRRLEFSDCALYFQCYLFISEFV